MLLRHSVDEQGARTLALDEQDGAIVLQGATQQSPQVAQRSIAKANEPRALSGQSARFLEIRDVNAVNRVGAQIEVERLSEPRVGNDDDIFRLADGIDGIGQPAVIPVWRGGDDEEAADRAAGK